MKLANLTLCAAFALFGLGGFYLLAYINGPASAEQDVVDTRHQAVYVYQEPVAVRTEQQPESSSYPLNDVVEEQDSEHDPLVPDFHYSDSSQFALSDLANADEAVFNLNPNPRLTNIAILDEENWGTAPGAPASDSVMTDDFEFEMAESDLFEGEVEFVDPPAPPTKMASPTPLAEDLAVEVEVEISDLPAMDPPKPNPDDHVFSVKNPGELASGSGEKSFDQQDDFIPSSNDESDLPEEFEIRNEMQLPAEFGGGEPGGVIASINDDSEPDNDNDNDDGSGSRIDNDFQPNEFLPRGDDNPTWWIAKVNQQQLQNRQPVRLTLDQAIFEALNNAPEVQIINTRPQIQQTVVQETDAAFDWNQFVNSSWREGNEPIGSSLTTGVTGVTRFEEREWAQEFGVGRQLRNGASFGAAQNFGTLDNNSSFLDPIDQGTSRLVLDYRQPFMRGRGAVATSQVAIARLDLQQIENDSLASLQNYMIEVVSAYWEVYLRRVSLVQRQRSRTRAEQLLRLLRNRKDIDVQNGQILRAEAAVASRQSDAGSAEFELMNAQDRLINLTSGPNTRNADSMELIVDQVPFSLAVEFASEEIVQAAIRNRPEVRAAIAQIRIGSVQKQIAANALLPRLDAVLQSFVSGVRGDRNIGGSFVDQFSAGNPSYSVGFEFEVPLGNRAAKSRFARSELEARIFAREFDQQVGDVVLDARVASREIRRLNRENKNNWEALTSALKELRIIRERQRLTLDDNKTGSLYIEDLLASQARLSAAEERLATSQASQAIAVLDLKRATGQLLNVGAEDIQPINFQIIPPNGVGVPAGEAQQAVPNPNLSPNSLSASRNFAPGQPLSQAPAAASGGQFQPSDFLPRQ